MFGQVLEWTFINNMFVPVQPELTFNVFNNNTDAQVPSMAGTIRIWPLLDGVGSPLTFDAVITAVDQDGNCAMQWVTKNRTWTDAGWVDYHSNFDVTKNAPWQTITMTVIFGDQIVTLDLMNNRFMSHTIFEEAWRESINIRFFQGVDPVLQLPIPLANMTMIVDGVEIADIRDFTINIAGWQTEAHTVFISKLSPWLEMTFRVEMYGQVWERTFINNMYTPAP